MIGPSYLLLFPHSLLLVTTVIFHFNARTGEDALGLSEKNFILQGHDTYPSFPADTYIPQHQQLELLLLKNHFPQSLSLFVSAMKTVEMEAV